MKLKSPHSMIMEYYSMTMIKYSSTIQSTEKCQNKSLQKRPTKPEAKSQVLQVFSNILQVGYMSVVINNIDSIDFSPYAYMWHPEPY